MKTVIPRNESKTSRQIEIKISGISDIEVALKIALGGKKIPEGFDITKIRTEKTNDGIKFYPYICCWESDGVIVWGLDWFGYCEYQGEGCPA